jgi:hypothetical protein
MSLPPDTRAAVHAYFKSLGSTDAQAVDAETLHTGKFDWVGDVLILKETQKPVTDPSVREWFETKAPHLLPTAIVVDEADAAFTGKNLTARMAYTKAHGMDEADRVARLYGLHAVSDTRAGVRPAEMPGEKKPAKGDTNPWSDIPGVTTDPKTGKYLPAALNKQFGLARANVTAAASIAAAAGAKLGDIRPPGRSRRVA